MIIIIMSGITRAWKHSNCRGSELQIRILISIGAVDMDDNEDDFVILDETNTPNIIFLIRRRMMCMILCVSVKTYIALTIFNYHIIDLKF